jgi:hypothetical protein
MVQQVAGLLLNYFSLIGVNYTLTFAWIL